MNESRLATRIRRKPQYSSYKGDNLIQRPFEDSQHYEKCYTDMTEFALPNTAEKLYLSPVIDGYKNRLHLIHSPDLSYVQTMLEKAFPTASYKKTILNSDQG